MNFDVSQLSVMLPEIFVLSMACIILIVDLFLDDDRRGLIHMLAVLTLIFAGILTLRPDTGAIGQTVMQGTFVRDAMSDLLKAFIYLLTAAVFTYAKHYLRERGSFKGEFYVLGLFAVLGMMIMVSAGSLLSLYLGLELLALCQYALVAINRDDPIASEAAMKYFVLGAIASGMLLYGASMIYGATGSLDFAEIAAAAGEANRVVMAFGVVFLVVGLAFKLGAVPFHMWLPDVYHGAPTAITAFIGSAPKLAAFGMAIRVLADGLQPIATDWQPMLVFMALLSLAVGNVVAIVQTNLKRMLAYSTISHVGFLLLGLIAATPEGYGAAMFYAIVYSIMSLGAFAAIILLSSKGFEADRIEDFRGLNQRSPWFAGMMLMLIASLAGFPPFLGFFAKLLVLQAVVDIGLTWLAVVAVVFAVIGAFYYLRVIKVMYFDEASDDSPVTAPPDFQAVLSANALAQIVLLLAMAPLIAACVAAFGV